MRKTVAIRETITYPKIAVNSDDNPCNGKTSLFEHVLSCGHLVTTPTPDEQCAPNCYRASRENGTTTRRTTLKNMALKNDFYCDACVEEDTEKKIAPYLSSKSAEKYRMQVRGRIAVERDKANNFRKCYIAQKFVSVPCDEDGDTFGAYDPYLSAHPYDTAWPPSGDNMFDDVYVLPMNSTKSKKKQRPSNTSLDESDHEPPSADEADAEDVDETVAEGARWLQEQDELEKRRMEEHTRRRRAAALPTIISSSPDTDMSSFVVKAGTNPRNATPTLGAPRKKRDRKRKRPAQDETAAVPTAQRVKRPKASPTTRSIAQAAKSEVPMRKKSSKEVCSIL